MSLSSKETKKLVHLIRSLNDQIKFGYPPRDRIALAWGGVTEEETYHLDEKGYESAYKDLARFIFSKPVGNLWSERTLRDRIQDLLSELAPLKKNDPPITIDFTKLAQRWYQTIDIIFPTYECYVAVIGLVTEKEFKLGEVTFVPIQDVKKISDPLPLISDSINSLPSHRSCLVKMRVQAERKRAIEILREKAEASINILRYMGSLVWWDQPTKHIYLEGRDRSRTSQGFSISDEGQYAQIGLTEYSPVPFNLGDEFFTCAEFYGLKYISGIANPTTEMDDCLFTAIQWYGDATQETNALHAFVKYYTAIETAFKLDMEDTNIMIDKIAMVISPWDEERRQQAQLALKELRRERNYVLHSGRPKEQTPEYLEWLSGIVSRQALNRLRATVSKHGIKEKSELATWYTEHNELLR